MSTDLQTLLALNPMQALAAMVNAQQNTKYRLDGFTVSAPVALDGLSTQVVLSGIPEAIYRDDSLPQGQITLTYNRLPIARWLANTLAGYHPVLPLSTQNILDEISRRTGQTFYIDDMVLEEVTRDNGAQYLLKAKAESLRWVGSVALPVISTIPITTFLSASDLTGLTDATPIRYLPGDAVPYLNATDVREVIAGLKVGDKGQDRIALTQLFNEAVPDPAHPDDFTVRPWQAVNAAVPFNLYNAKVVRFQSGLGLNPAIPTLDSAIVVTLDHAFCTNFSSGEVVIPYTAQNFELDGFTQFPRLIHESVVSLSDGTAFAAYLNGFKENQVITNVPATPPLLIDGPVAWTTTPGLPLPTNLSGATVLYNGPLRAQDLPAAVQGLDRVLEVRMSLDNSVWRESYPFYYAGAVQLASTVFAGSVGSTVNISLVPTRGKGPYTYVMTGAVPDGLTFDPTTGMLAGTYTKQAGYLAQLTVTDGNGDSWTFNLVFNVTAQIFELILSGTLPDATVGEAYFGFLDIVGGLTPYNPPEFIAGVPPASLRLAVVGTTVQVSGIWPEPGTFPLAIGLTSADGQRASSSQQVKVTGDPLTAVTITGTLPQGQVGTPYAATLDVAGGTGDYTNLRLTDGALPDGISMHYNQQEIVFEGSPTAAFDATFTLAIDSATLVGASTQHLVITALEG